MKENVPRGTFSFFWYKCKKCVYLNYSLRV